MEHIDHVLVVDDDREIREMVSGYLRKNGLRVSLAADGRQMRSFLEADRVDLVVLDIMMPGDDGLVLCRELRAGRHRTTPVLMLTARSDETDRIVGLEMGADDYLVKPFSARELLARIKAVLRRTRMLPPNLQVTEAGRLVAFGAWRLDTTARHLLDEAGTVVPLSGAEYRLLRVLLDHPSGFSRATSSSTSRRAARPSCSTARSTSWSAACASACRTTPASRPTSRQCAARAMCWRCRSSSRRLATKWSVAAAQARDG